ncbi:MAG: hypothetical protein WC223_05375 [Bacteroidales bacterium]|jgi:hypothetical protein
MIDKKEAMKIAEENAKKAYRDLSIYNIESKLTDGKWYIDYFLKDKGMVGGGPHFVISAESGEIISYRFAQ